MIEQEKNHAEQTKSDFEEFSGEQRDPFQEDISSSEALRLRQAFIDIVLTGSENELKEAMGLFIDALQNEANSKFPGAKRDYWFNYQLVQAYIDASLWEQAYESIQDLFDSYQLDYPANSEFSKQLALIENYLMDSV